MKDNENRVPRMRTLPKAMEEIKKADPETQFTLAALRKMIDRGYITVAPVRVFVNVDDKITADAGNGWQL